MTIQSDLIAFLNSIEGMPPVHYQHMDGNPGDRFVWAIISGSDMIGETLDRGELPDTIYFDLEAYSNSLTDLGEIIELLFTMQDYDGPFGTGEIQDFALSDQRDDYTPLADAETLPKYSANFRLTIIGYEPPE